MQEEVPNNRSEAPNLKERETTSTARWLSGIFEIGGAIDFHKRESMGKVDWFPRLRFSDNDEKRIRFFQQNFGGYLYKITTGTWEWGLSGKKAALLLEAMRDSSPSRRSVIEAAGKWLSASSIEQKVAIANVVTESIHPSVQPADYATLVIDPVFLAGVFDGRGNVFSVSRHNRPSQDSYFQVKSQNQSLLEALQKEYGGGVYQNVHQPRLAEERVRSFTWRIEHRKNVNTILDNIRLYIKFPDKIHLPIAA